jgi:hypothetical protein
MAKRVFSVAIRYRHGLRDADPAAHGDAVHERDGRLGIGEEQVVEPVFDEEEVARFLPVARAALRQHANVPARAKAAALGMIDQHRPDPESLRHSSSASVIAWHISRVSACSAFGRARRIRAALCR